MCPSSRRASSLCERKPPSLPAYGFLTRPIFRSLLAGLSFTGIQNGRAGVGSPTGSGPYRGLLASCSPSSTMAPLRPCAWFSFRARSSRRAASSTSSATLAPLEPPPGGLQGVTHQRPGVGDGLHQGHLVLVARARIQESLGGLQLAVGVGQVLPQPLQSHPVAVFHVSNPLRTDAPSGAEGHPGPLPSL